MRSGLRFFGNMMIWFVTKRRRKRINALVDRITDALGQKGKTPPLVPGMDEMALSHALAANFEQDEDAKLVHFLNQLSLEMQRSSGVIAEITAVATYALSYGGNERIAIAAVDVLYGV